MSGDVGRRERLRPNVVLSRTVANRSARLGGPASIRLIVLHTTESHNRPGTSDLAGVVEWFDTPAAAASAHVIVDADGTSARCVPDSEKAWACADFNSASLNIEQIGLASSSRRQWLRRWREIREAARWCAEWSLTWGIPLRHVGPTGHGVTTHAELGIAGGGHTDPGRGYPIGRMLILARLYKRMRRRK